MKPNEPWILTIDYLDGRGGAKTIVGKGPVELMQTASKEAGVEVGYPTVGQWYLYAGVWQQAVRPGDYPYPVIPAPEPEPEPCPNCQNAKGFCYVRRDYINGAYQCEICGKGDWEWTYATDLGGIGGGGTGGPL